MGSVEYIIIIIIIIRLDIVKNRNKERKKGNEATSMQLTNRTVTKSIQNCTSKTFFIEPPLVATPSSSSIGAILLALCCEGMLPLRDRVIRLSFGEDAIGGVTRAAGESLARTGLLTNQLGS